jgi:hypothetical protein
MTQHFVVKINALEGMSILSRTMTGSRDTYSNPAQDRGLFAGGLANFLCSWHRYYDGELPELREDIFKLSKHNSSYYSLFLAVASIVCGRRKLFLTSHGHIGLGPETMSKGEIVCVLGGATMPHFLKKVGGYFLLVEDCFVDNLMDGEAVIAMQKSEAHLGPILTGNFLKGKPPTQMSDTGKRPRGLERYSERSSQGIEPADTSLEGQSSKSSLQRYDPPLAATLEGPDQLSQIRIR